MTGTKLSIVWRCAWCHHNVLNARYETYLLHYFETIAVVAMEDVRSHEGEYGHHSLCHCFGRELGKASNEKQGKMESLGIVGN